MKFILLLLMLALLLAQVSCAQRPPLVITPKQWAKDRQEEREYFPGTRVRYRWMDRGYGYSWVRLICLPF